MNNKGFTLIEVIISTLILAIGVLAMVKLFPTASVVNARADRVNEATVLAEGLTETFRCAGYDTLKSIIDGGTSSGSYKIESITVSWQLTEIGTIIQTNVMCQWPLPGRLTKSQYGSVNIVTNIGDHE